MILSKQGDSREHIVKCLSGEVRTGCRKLASVWHLGRSRVSRSLSADQAFPYPNVSHSTLKASPSGPGTPWAGSQQHACQGTAALLSVCPLEAWGPAWSLVLGCCSAVGIPLSLRRSEFSASTVSPATPPAAEDSPQGSVRTPMQSSWPLGPCRGEAMMREWLSPSQRMVPFLHFGVPEPLTSVLYGTPGPQTV